VRRVQIIKVLVDTMMTRSEKRRRRRKVLCKFYTKLK
jgi:hypothetical protein